MRRNRDVCAPVSLTRSSGDGRSGKTPPATRRRRKRQMRAQRTRRRRGVAAARLRHEPRLMAEANRSLGAKSREVRNAEQGNGSAGTGSVCAGTGRTRAPAPAVLVRRSSGEPLFRESHVGPQLTSTTHDTVLVIGFQLNGWREPGRPFAALRAAVRGFCSHEGLRTVGRR